jgi:hypothetical protein
MAYDIAAQQRMAKVNDDIQRRKDATKAIEFYNFNQLDHVIEKIGKLYPETWNDIKEYAKKLDLVRSIIDDTAILFTKPITVVVDGTDAQKTKAEQIFAGCELWKKLLISDRMADLTGKVGVAIHWHPTDKRVVLDVITSDKCFIEQDPQDPTKAIKVYYQVGTMQNTAQAVPVNIYSCWTADSYYEVEIGQNYTEGKKIPGSEIPNPYGRIPIVWFSKRIETDSFWGDYGNALVETCLNQCIRETNLDITLDFQAFSTLVTSGLNSNEKLTFGVKRRIDLPVNDTDGKAQGEAYYITPDPKLEILDGIIQRRKIDLAKENGLSAEAYNRETSSISSGYQLRLTKQEVLNDNELKKEVYRPEIVMLIHNILDCYTYNSQDMRFDPDIPVKIEFGKIVFDTNPIEQQQIYTLEIANGLRSRIEILAETRHITKEEAVLLAETIDQENGSRLAGAGMNTATWLQPEVNA